MNSNTENILKRKKLRGKPNGSTENLNFYYAEELEQPYVIVVTDSEEEDLNRPAYDSEDSTGDVYKHRSSSKKSPVKADLASG